MELLTQKDLELLERKVLGTLSKEDEKLLGEKMKEEPFVQAAKDFELLLASITAEGDVELKAMLVEEEAKLETISDVKAKAKVPEKTAKVFTLNRLMAAAAAILLLVVATFVWQQNTVETKDYFADNFVPYRNVLYPIDRSGTITNAKQKAFVAYEQKDFNQALEGFERSLKDSLDYNVLFFKGNTLLALDNTEEGIKTLAQIPQHERFYEQTQWYIAIAHLKKGDYVLAKSYLETVAKSGGFKHEKAKEILKELN